jgi:hydroxymethylpyrimidine/phosphomethylpyrimidine kinase
MTCLLGDIPPAAIKTGMLASSSIIRTIISILHSTYLTTSTPNEKPLGPLPPLIIDPVSVSTSKHSLLTPSAIGDLVFGLIPMGRLITPNSLEAEMIVRCIRAGAKDGAGDEVSQETLGRLVGDHQGDEGVKIDGLESMIDAGTEMLGFIHSKSEGLGGGMEKGVLVKGGHVPLPRSEFRDQLKAIRTGLKETDLRVVWNGNSLDAGQGDEEFIEFLAAYRESSFNQITLDSSSSSRTQANPTPVQDQEEEFIVDVLLTSKGDDREKVEVTLFVAPSIKSRSTHGTGCTLSAAIASYVAHGKTCE